MAGQDAFRKRLQTAIDMVFSGNVSAAAEGLGVLQPTLHKILAGRIGESKASTVALLADRLGVKVSWLRGDSDDPVEYPTDLAPQRSIPLGHHLVLAYHYRQVNDYRDWIRQLGRPKTKAGKALLEAFLAWDRDSTREELTGRTPKQNVLTAYVSGLPEMPPEHLDWLRSSLAENVAFHRLVVRRLEDLGEKPQAYQRTQRTAGLVSL